MRARFFLFLLVCLLGAGVLFQGAMAVTMGIDQAFAMQDDGHHSGCDACGDDGTDSALCGMTCASPAASLYVPAWHGDARNVLQAAPPALFLSWASPPDPFPPRV